jgi:transposase-like protein
VTLANAPIAETPTSEMLPCSLPEAVRYFSDEGLSVKYLASRRWPDGVVRCPTCGSRNVRFLASRQLWECSSDHSKAQFSVRAGTIFEDSHIPLGHWLVAIWLLATSDQPVSSYQMASRLGITQKSAWFMLRRIGCALEIKGSSASGLKQELYGSSLRSRPGDRTMMDPR